MRWTWEDGPRTWHSDVTVPRGENQHVMAWHGIFDAPGIHRIDLRAHDHDHADASAFIVVTVEQSPRVAISGQAVRDRTSGSHRAIPIGLLVGGSEAEGRADDEIRWLDRGVEVRSREVNWLMHAADGWLHMGGSAASEFGSVNQFRAHFRIAADDDAAVDQAEIRLYPPGANPGVDPPQRVIAGPIQALRRRGSITT